MRSIVRRTRARTTPPSQRTGTGQSASGSHLLRQLVAKAGISPQTHYLSTLQAKAGSAVLQRESFGFKDLYGSEGLFHSHITYGTQSNSLHLSFTDARDTKLRKWQFVYAYKLHEDTWDGPHDSIGNAPQWAKDKAASDAPGLKETARNRFRALDYIQTRLRSRQEEKQKDALKDENAFPALGTPSVSGSTQTGGASTTMTPAPTVVPSASFSAPTTTTTTTTSSSNPSAAATKGGTQKGPGKWMWDEDYGMSTKNKGQDSDDMDHDLYA